MDTDLLHLHPGGEKFNTVSLTVLITERGVCKHKWRVLKLSIRKEGGGKRQGRFVGLISLFEEQASCLPATAFSTDISLGPLPQLRPYLLNTAAALSQAATISAQRSLSGICYCCNDGMNWEGNKPWGQDNGPEVSS